MMRYLSRALLLASAGLVLSAASCGGQPACDEDGDCEGACVDGECVECRTDAQCADGLICGGGECLPCGPLPDGPTCGPGLGCDDGRCVALPSCSPACGGGQVCVEGQGGNRCVYTTVVDALQYEGLANMHEVVSDPRKAGIDGELRAAEAVTLFAPKDPALVGLSADCNAALDDDPIRWARLARHHILFDAISVDRATLDAGVADGPLELAMQSSEFVTLAGGQGLTVDGYPVGGAIEALNGWVHVLDAGLLLPASVEALGCERP